MGTVGYENIKSGAGEMAQRSRTLVTLVEDLGSVPSIHIVVHNHP